MKDNSYSFSDYYFTETITYNPTASIKNKLFLNNHTFDDDDTKSYTYTALATAYSTPDGSSLTYHGTIVDALNTTYDKNTTVVPIQSFSHGGKTYTAGSDSANADYSAKVKYQHKIDGDCTIASNVTLLIPYGTDVSGYYSFSSRKYTPELITSGTSSSSTYMVTASAYDNGTKYCKNSITVLSGKKLTNNGKIIIPGIITGGSGGSPITSVTALDHSRINLQSNSKIENGASTADITCYGYIDELGENTKVSLPQGNLNVVFSIVEHRGGAIFLAMAGGISSITSLKIKDTSPFNRFYVESVTSTIEVTEGATVNGFYDLYVTEHLSGSIGFFGKGSGYFIGFDENDGKNSKAFLKYNPDDQQNELIIQGNASINKLDVSIKMYISITLSTQDVYLPLSHYWNLSFQRFNGNGEAATINATGQDIKIMPGAQVRIEEGVTVKAKNIAVYTKTAPDLGNAGSFNYFAKAAEDVVSSFDETTSSTYVDGSLIVAGSLELTGGLGGYVQPEGNNATLKISSKSVTVKELVTSTGTGTDGKVTYTDPALVISATGPVATSDNSSTVTNLSNTGTYTSINGVWFKPYVTITLNPNGGNPGDTGVELPVNKATGVTNQNNLLNATKPTWTGHTFAGWYLDEACTTPYSPSDIKYDATLYAKWTLDATVTFVTNGGTEVSTILVAISDTGISESDLERIKSAISIKTNHNLVAWCVDEGLTTEVTAAWFAGKGSAITLYAKWEEVETHRVELHMGELDGRTDLFSIDHVEAPMGTVLTLPKVSNIDNTITENKYFIGWALSYDGDVVTDIKIDDLDEIDVEGEKTYILYAKWGTKVTVTFDASEYSKLITLLSTKVVNGGIQSIYLKPGATYDVSSFGNYQYLDDANPLLDHESYFDGAWIVQSGVTITDNVLTVDSAVNDGDSITVKPQWNAKYAFKTDTTSATITISVTANVGGTEKTYTYTSNTSNTTYYAVPEAKITASVNYTSNNYRYAGCVGFNDSVDDDTGLTSGATSIECTIDKNEAYKLYATSGTRACLAAGTLVTLADGSQKKIEDVLLSDQLLVFNHETGRFVIGEIMLIETHDGWSFYDIINASFSNGTIVRIINEHGFFDLTLNKYVYITMENYEQFIGHEFAVVNGDGFESVILEEVFITTEYTGIYNIVTKYHLNCISNGLLSMSGAIEGTFNIFEYDQNLKYDEDKMATDIEKYGLFTYEDFAEHVPKEVFDMFPAQYFKVSIEKGYTTYEQLLALANEYLVKHGYYAPNN